MPGPIIQALLAALRAGDAQRLLSLALVDEPEPIAGATRRARQQLIQLYVDDPSAYTACHHVAAQLCDILSAGARGDLENAEGIARAIEIINTRRGIVWLQFGTHSFVLVSTAAGVECIEAWAGQGQQAFPLHECLNVRADDIVLTHEQTVAALGELLSANRATREAAMNRLSRAGPLGFGPRDRVPALRVRAFNLAANDEITAAMRELVNAARQWAG